jgi:hypothetical protein
MKILTIVSAVVGVVACANCLVKAGPTNSVGMAIEWDRISNDVQAASALLPNVEKLWPDQSAQYFETEKKIGNILGGFSENPSAKQSLVGLFTNVVQKPFPSGAEQVVSFVELERDFVLDGLKFEPIRNNRVAYGAIAHLLGEIRSREIANYSFRGTSLPGREILIKAGVMDPNLLTDPILKQRYAQAVEQNKQDLAMNSFQASLMESDSILVFHLLNARVLIPPHDAADANFFKALSETAHLTTDEQHQIGN